MLISVTLSDALHWPLTITHGMSSAAIQVNSSKPNGIYGVGEDIYIKIYMSTLVVRAAALC